MKSRTSHAEKFRLNLLGEFALITSSGDGMAISAKKSKALLAYLALSQSGTSSRDRIAGLLWSDTELTFAKTNLRQCLSALRKQLDNPTNQLITSRADQLTLDMTKIELDIERLCELEAETTAADAVSIVSRLAQGAFLPDFPSVDPEFDRWLDAQRAGYLNRYGRALEKFMDPQASDHNAIQSLAKALLTIEPENEKAHLCLMKHFLQSGDRLAALRQFELCRTAMATQLDTTPGPDITRLYNSVKQNNIDKNPRSNVERPVATQQAESNKPQPARNGFAESSNRILLTATLATALAGLAVAYMWRLNLPEQYTFLTSSDTVQEQASLISYEPSPNKFQQQHSIAVIPLRNLSENADQTYLSDGISEDLVTEISRISGINVIASESSFRFRDRADNLEQLKQQLPVDYLLTGSVRKSGAKLRINVHLIRTSDNTYVWSDKLDREMKDLLRVQDEITRHIVSSLSVELTESEWLRLSQHREVSPEAYDLLLRGLHPFSQFTEEGVSSARDYFLQSIQADPNYARPYANMALSFGREVVFQFAEPDPEAIRAGLQYADKAETLNPSLPQTQFARAVLHLANRDHHNAVTAARQSIAIDPNYADGFAVLAQTLAYSGKLDEALEAISHAKRLNPIVPFTYKWVEGHILYLLQRYTEAEETLQSVYESNPSFYIGLLSLSATYGQLGDTDSAEWINQEILTHKPDFTSKLESKESPYLLRQHRDHLLDGLLKAGLPE